jgi:hypothetical protein
METTDLVYPVTETGMILGQTLEGVEIEDVVVFVENMPYLPAGEADNYAYIMTTTDGMPDSEPIIPVHSEKITAINV